MGMLTNNQLQTIIDKLARFATESVGDPEFNAAFTAGMETASQHVLSGAGGIATYLLTLNDEDIEADLLPSARDLDEQHPTLADGTLLTITGVNAIINALNTHFKRNNYKGLDDYMTIINTATPTLRAHGHFKKYLKTLSAKNNFIPNDIQLATLTMTSATAGTYGHLNSIDTTKYAGAKIVLKNLTALGSAPVVSVTAKKLDGTSSVLTATISTATINTETNLSDVTQLYVDVTAISITTGTSGNQIAVVAKTDRSIASA
ncbi:MAG TPA: hypothetical protein VKE51_34695 [Vicinamibacterales bacterium]|nr:hypothetical protein [Vicinamibacterales bacterium]